MKPLAFRRSLQEVPKGPEPPKDRRRKAAVWAAAKVGFSRLSVFVSPEPIAFRRWTFSCGYPIQFLLSSFGVFGHWAETGKKCPQPVLVIFDSIFHLPAETGKKALQTAPVGFKIILYLIQHQSSS